MSNYPHFTREALQELLTRARAQGRDAGVLEKLEWFVFFFEHGSSLEDTATHFDIAEGTLRRWMKRFDPRDLSTLEERSHAPHNVRTSTVAPEIVEWIREYRISSPLLGKERIAQLLRQEHNVSISASTVGRVIERQKLYFASMPLHWSKRFQDAPLAPPPIDPVPKPEPQLLEETPVSSHAPQQCECVFCRLAQLNWFGIRSAVAWSLIMVNLAFMAIVFGTVWHEHAQAQLQEVPVMHTVAPQLDGYMPEPDTSVTSSLRP